MIVKGAYNYMVIFDIVSGSNPLSRLLFIISLSRGESNQEQPLVAPQVSHFSQVPLRTIVKFWHSEHMLPV